MSRGAAKTQVAKGSLRYLRHDGPEHIIAIAPTRSGKGVGLVIPTLNSWRESVVVYDTKGENYVLSAGWRSKHANNVVLRFDPAEPEGSCSFNPLAEVRFRQLQQVADVQNLVTMVVDPDGKGLEDHWAKTSHAFLTGVALHVLYLAQDPERRMHGSLAEIGDLLADPSRPITDLFNEMLTYDHGGENATEGDKQAHLVIQQAARDMLNKAENERSGVLSTAMSFLTLYRDPIIRANTERSDWRIDDLMDHDRPVSLYIVVSPANKDRLKPLVRLVINQIVRGRTRESMKPDEQGRVASKYRHRLLLMLDEFASLGRLDVFQESLAYIAGYGMKAYLIIQDVEQLYNSYGQNESIISNCHIRIAYAPNKVSTAEWMSKMTGVATIVKEQVSVSGKRTALQLDSVNTSFDEKSRPLLTADECMRLRGPEKDRNGNIVRAGEMLVFVAGFAPVRGTQILFFKDPVLLQRSKVTPPPTDRIRTIDVPQWSTSPIAAASGFSLEHEQHAIKRELEAAALPDFKL